MFSNMKLFIVQYKALLVPYSCLLKQNLFGLPLKRFTVLSGGRVFQ